MDNYDDLTINDLRTLLSARGEPTSFRLKADLVKRLRRTRVASTLVSTNNDFTSTDESVIEINENSTIEETDDSDSEVFDEQNGKPEESSNEGNYKSDDEDEMAPIISFNDVKDALKKFKGGSKIETEKWITEFDKISVTCGWNDVQKYIFALKLMDGEASAIVEENSSITIYEELTTVLKAEYKEETSFLEIHKALVDRKKKNDETSIEYMYKMMTLGRNTMDEKSLIEYIVDGLPDDRKSKTTLYESNSYNDLKCKLRVFKSNTSLKNSNTKNPSKEANKYQTTDKKIDVKIPQEKKCYNCGGKGHMKTECPEANKGKKCFNCGSFGHVSKDCLIPKKTTNEAKNTTNGRAGSMMMIRPDVDRPMTIPVTINGEKVTALVDSGAAFTVMTRATFQAVKLDKWVNDKYPLRGFGNKKTLTLGKVEVNVWINGEVYILQCMVVENGMMSSDMVLGRDWFIQTIVTFDGGVINVKKRSNEIPENDIMTIELDTEEMQVEDLPCIQEISDPMMRQEVAKLVRDYKPKLGQKSCVEMEILVTDNIPVYQNPRRLSAMERDVASSMVAKFIEAGIVQPSKSPYASPILLRKKKNGTYRFCVDYRKMNEKIIKDRHPLPLMEDLIEDLHDELVHSSLDLTDGFYHVDMAPNSTKYTAFITPDGQYEFLKAPQGLCNSPANFQRYINQVFHEARLQKMLKLYLDDVLVSSKDEASNLEKLRRVLEIAAEAGLRINFRKCKFLQRRLTFLGYVIEYNNIHPSDEKKKAIQNFPQPTTMKAVQSFLGLTGYFRKFIANYATFARPLSDLLRKEGKFTFGSQQQESFMILKEKLVSDPVLRIYNPKAETELHTDASALGYGGCLLQRQQDDGAFHPVYYLSFKTTPAEAKLHSYELEVLAIIRCLDKLRVFLLGISFTIFTDCKAFEMTMARKNATAKVARWALALEEYEMVVKHRPGKSMQHVDALSRQFMMQIEDGILHLIRNAQKNDNECKLIRQLIEKGVHDDYVLRDEVLYKFRNGGYLLKIPNTMANDILATIHGDGHVSRRTMEVMAQQQYEITDLGKKIDKLIMNCVPCILATKKRGKKDGWLQSIDKHDTPMHTYHIDHLGPIPSTNKNYQHILVVVDAFTKFNWLYPVKSTGIAEAIQKLQKQEEIFGNPRRIIADKYSSFRGNDFDEYCKQRGIQLHLITTGTPRGNGQVERMNSIIIPMVTKLTITDPTKWYKYVAKVQTCINTSVARSTKSTPFKMMFGVEMNSPEDLQINEVLENELINEFNSRRVEWRQQAKENIAKIQQENQEQYNKKRKTAKLYAVGDLVAIERVQMEKGLKFKPKMLGPYEVTRVLRNHRYEVRKVGFHDGPMNTSTSDIL